MEREGVRRHGSALVPASDATNQQLGLAVKQLRARRGLSQEDLAHASGLHPTYISGIERGLRNPTWKSLSRLSGALGVKLSELAALAEGMDDRRP